MRNGTFAGRIGTDAETRYTNDQQAVTNFSLAVDRPKKNGEKQNPLWVKAVIWGKRGESLAQYLTKGSTVAITGAVDLERYENRDGETVTNLIVFVNEVSLLGGGSNNNENRNNNGNGNGNGGKKNNRRNEPEEIDDSDIPF